MLTRRGFFMMLGLSGFLPFLPSQAAEFRSRSVDLLEFFVAGFQYHQGMDRAVFQSLEVGQPLDLVREPENPHDELAIAVHAQSGHRLGYVPMSCNEIPDALADQSVTLRACITEIHPDAPPWERLIVKVWQEV